MTAEGQAAVQLEPEDRARADCYALIGRLFIAAPNKELLAALATPGPEENEPSDLAITWRALQQASAGAIPDLLREEHEQLFIGVGKALITPYTSGYASPSGPDRHLVRLRDCLAKWDLARPEAVFEMEDHIAAVCDVMRWLIEDGRSWGEQKAFFNEFVYAGSRALCNAVAAASPAVFYRPVAAYSLAFFELERTAFELFESA
jgi:TorA maturation chaperone TorD